MRKIALIAAKNQFVIKAKYIAGVDNRLPDWLSRWHSPEARKQFRAYARDKSLKHRKISNQYLEHQHKW